MPKAMADTIGFDEANESLRTASRAAGLERIGLTLLAALPSDSNQVIDDPALISRWAELLDISTWLIWLPMAPQ